MDAAQVFLIMKHNFRVSRNARAQWYFRHLNKFIEVERDAAASSQSQDNHSKLHEANECEMEIAGILPSPDELTAGKKYRVTPTTVATFLARRYRLVFVLDLSPSVATVDIQTMLCPEEKCIIVDRILDSLTVCLRKLSQKFTIPGSYDRVYQPHFYATVIAYSQFLEQDVHQVLVQGSLVSADNVDILLDELSEKLLAYKELLAKKIRSVGTYFAQTKINTHAVSSDLAEHVFAHQSSELALRPLMVTADTGFVNMIRKGILATQLMPENTAAGLVILTDAVTGVPDIGVLETLLTQLRNSTISCSVIQVRNAWQLDCSLGHVPFSELLQFLSHATFGAYLSMSAAQNESMEMNVFHKTILCWSFQHALHGEKYDPCFQRAQGCGAKDGCTDPHSLPAMFDCLALPAMKQSQQLSCCTLNTSLANLLSVRLREGYTIKGVSFLKSGTQIRVELMLPWHFTSNLEYHMICAWPDDADGAGSVKVEVHVEGPYDFLCDVTAQNPSFKSPHRAAVATRFSTTVRSLGQTDKLLVHLHSFNSNPIYYTMPEYVKGGMPVFYLAPNTEEPMVAVRDQHVKNHQYIQFCNFWRPVCMLDINIWQKWLHTHRFTLILTHDSPLPRHVHVPSPSNGRYASIRCQQAGNLFNEFLKRASSFTLIENHSYVVLVTRSGETVPAYFYIIRVAYKPPCVVVRLAFLGGTLSSERNKVSRELAQRMADLLMVQRYEHPADFLFHAEDAGDQSLVVAPFGNEAKTQTPACILTRKPLEKILLKYAKVPRNLWCFVDYDEATHTSTSAGGASRHVASSLYSILSRYLLRRRWIWSLKIAAGLPMTSQAAAVILQTLTRRRLHEGFHIAVASIGVVNMVYEFDVKEHLTKTTENVQPCLSQYLLLPPTPAAHLPKNASSHADLFADHDTSLPYETESTEADTEFQLVTELWLEPQAGTVQNLARIAPVIEHCDVTQMLDLYFELDREVIFALVTYEHLCLLCREAERISVLEIPSDPPSITPTVAEGLHVDHDPQPVVFVASCFDLPVLCKHAQLATCVFSTLSVRDRFVEHDDPMNKTYLECVHVELARSNQRSLTLHETANVQLLRLVDRRLRALGIDIQRAGLWLHGVRQRVRISTTDSQSTLGGDSESTTEFSHIPCLHAYFRLVDDHRLLITIAPRSFRDVLLMQPETVQLGSVPRFGGSGPLTFPVFLFYAYLPQVVYQLTEARRANACLDLFEDYTHRTSESVLSSLHKQCQQLDAAAAGINGTGAVALSRSPSTTTTNVNEPLSDEFNILSHCADLDACCSNAFVHTVYTALLQGSEHTISETDIMYAIDGKCEEMVMELNMSEFLRLVCRHARESRENLVDVVSEIGSRSEHMSDLDWPLRVDEIDEQSSADSVCASGIHEHIHRKFAAIMFRHFRVLPQCPDYWYYCPAAIVEPVFAAGRNDQTLSAPADESQHDGDVDASSIAFQDDTDEIDGQILTTLANRKRTRRSTNPSSSSSEIGHPTESEAALPANGVTESDDSSSSDSNEDTSGALDHPLPLFLQFTCSLRYCNELYSCTIRTIPTCLTDLINNTDFDEQDFDFKSLQITVDVVALTLPQLGSSDAHLASTDESSERLHSSMLQSMTTSVGSWGSIDSLNEAGDNSSVVQKRLITLPAAQRKVLSWTLNEVSMLLEDEISFALRESTCINSPVLRTVCAHIGRRIDCEKQQTHACVKELPLTFVMNEQRSFERFTAALGALRILHYQLIACGDGYFYLSPLDMNLATGMPHEHPLRPVGEVVASEEAHLEPDECALPVAGLRDTVADTNVQSASCTRHHKAAAFVMRCNSFDEGKRRQRSEKRRRRSHGMMDDVVGVLRRKISRSFHELHVHSSLTDSLIQMDVDGQSVVDGETGYDAESEDCVDHETLCDSADDQFDGQRSDAGVMARVPQFWLVVHANQPNVAKTYFHERSFDGLEAQHTNLVSVVDSEMQFACCRVNQFMLLEDLFETKKASSLLIAEKEQDAWPSAPVDDEEQSSDMLAAGWNYRPGTFRCPCVWLQAFVVHPRLKVTGPGKPGLANAHSVLHSLLDHMHMSVPNRKDVFVYRCAKGDVVYLKLHEYSAGANQQWNKLKVLQEETRPFVPDRDYHRMKDILEEVKTQDAVLLSVHGICAVGADLCEELVALLQSKLDEKVLDVLSGTLERNPNCKLTPEDIAFIQPPRSEPATQLRFKIPPIAVTHLYALRYYLHQNLVRWLALPNVTSQPASWAPQSRSGSPALPMPGSAVIAPRSDTERFVFLYNRHRQDRAQTGVAFVMLNYVDGCGNAVSVIRSDPVDPQGFSVFFTPDAAERYSEMTEPRLYGKRKAAVSLKRPGPVALLQFSLWQRGDIGATEMVEHLTTSVRHALCDLATEYGLLVSPLMEVVSHSGLDGGPASEPGSPTHKEHGKQHTAFHTIVRKRHSSALFRKESDGTGIRRGFSLAGTGRAGPMASISSDEQLKLAINDDVHGGGTRRLNLQFLVHCCQWFDYMLSAECESVKKIQCELAMQLSRSHFLTECYTWLQSVLEPSGLTVTCFARDWDHGPTTSFSLFKPARHSATSVLHGISDVANMETELGTAGLAHGVNGTEYVIFGQERHCSKDTPERSTHGLRGEGAQQQLDPRVGPLFPPHIVSGESHTECVPRQRFFFLVMNRTAVKVYIYNWSMEFVTHVKSYFLRLSCWQNARCALMQQIILQKMGIFRVGKPTVSHAKTNMYLGINWFDPEPFVRSTAPTVLPKPTNKIQQPLRLFKPFAALSDLHDWLSAVDLTNGRCTSQDPVQQQGMQLLRLRAMVKQAIEQRVQLRTLHDTWSRTPVEDPSLPIEAPVLRTLLAHSRRVHFVDTPVLFHTLWRERMGMVRCPVESMLLRDMKGRQRTRQPSGSQPMMSQPTSKQSRDSAADDTWHTQLLKTMMHQFVQYLHYLGLRVLNVHTDSADQQSVSNPYDALEYYLGKTSSSLGFIVAHLHFRMPYLVLSIYAADITSFSGSQADRVEQTRFTIYRDCQRFVAEIHMHSFAYDFHLRMLRAYVSEQLLVFRPGYQTQAFLEDFLRYYNCRPPFARTCCFEDHLVVSGLSVNAQTLYDHVLDHNREYGFQVMRMRSGSIRMDHAASEEPESEYFLVGVTKIPNALSGDDDYEVVLLVFRNIEDSIPAPPVAGRTHNSHDSTLGLKLYLIFMNLREAFPKLRQSGEGVYQRVHTSTPSPTKDAPGPPDARWEGPGASAGRTSPVSPSGKFAQSTMSGPESPRQVARFQIETVDEGPTGLEHRRSSLDDTTRRLQRLAAALHSPTASFHGYDVSAGMQISVQRSISSARRVRNERTVWSEMVTHLTYVGQQEISIQEAIHHQAADVKHHLKAMLENATQHCRRNILWKKMLQGCAPTSDRRKADANGISFAEFDELLTFVDQEPLKDLDPALEVLLDMSYSRLMSLLKTLLNKWSGERDKLVRHLSDKDEAKQYLMLVHTATPDTGILLVGDATFQSADVMAVYRDERSSVLKTDDSLLTTKEKVRVSKVHALGKLFAEFVNAVGYNLWAKLL